MAPFESSGTAVLQPESVFASERVVGHVVLSGGFFTSDKQKTPFYLRSETSRYSGSSASSTSSQQAQAEAQLPTNSAFYGLPYDDVHDAPLCHDDAFPSNNSNKNKKPKEIEWGETPVRTTCEHCCRKITTKVKRACNLWWMPFVGNDAKDLLHTCPKCKSCVARVHVGGSYLRKRSRCSLSSNETTSAVSSPTLKKPVKTMSAHF